MKTVGFIGVGKMGSIMALSASKCGDASIFVSDKNNDSAKKAAGETGGRAVSNNEAAGCDYLFLGVKPQQAETVISEIRPELDKAPHVIVSMMAGWTMERLAKCSGNSKIIRILPNTPAAIGEGMTLYARSTDISEEELGFVLKLLEHTGRLFEIEERLIDSASSVTGSGPAFACMFVDALADGAVRMGVPRDLAIECAAQMMAGTGKLILETGKHPDALKDEVCSPAGSTIEGVAALENGNFRGSIINAVTDTCMRNRELG